MLNKTCVFGCVEFVKLCVKILTLSTVTKKDYRPTVFLNKFLTHFIDQQDTFFYTPITSLKGGFYTLTTPITINITI